MWIEYVQNTVSKQNIKIINQIEYKNIITKNKTVIDIVQEYIIEKQLDHSVLNKINMVQLWKKVYLLVELVGYYGKNKTKAYKHINEISIIKWSFPFITVPKPRGDKII